jgi:uncharacterized HhH-GPD family protein
MSETLPFTGEPAADELLSHNPLALVIGMLLDQQVPFERAFSAPYRLRERLDGRLDCGEIADMTPDAIEAVFKAPPALHRFPGAMAKRTQALCQHVIDNYDGDVAAIWADPASGQELLKRIRALPGFGDEKAKIFTALLGKRLGVRPDGWEQVVAPFDDDKPRSVADIDSPETLAKVRAWKREMRAAGKSKQD